MSTPAWGSLIPASRVRLAVAAGAVVGLVSRLAGRGSGASVGGHVILRLAPDALPAMLRGKRVAMVSGTNGKTTTTHFLAAAVRQSLTDGESRVVHNADGANLVNGVVFALSRKPQAEFAILETDERVVAEVVRVGHPEVLVLLNFSRDQLDRNHEIKSLARSWRQALQDAGPSGPLVVANAGEPLIVWAAQTARDVVWVSTASTWTQDTSFCPQCGSTLARQPSDEGELLGGHWYCTGCDLAQPAATYLAREGRLTDAEGRTWDPQLNVPGEFNVGNAACALAAANAMGVPSAVAVEGLRAVSAPAGRFATTTVQGTTARLLLAKNPAGWAEALPLATTSTVVLAIDSAAADGRDVSWLWDVEFEQLKGRRVIATGPRAQDLAIRLLYADVEHQMIPDLAEALTGHHDPVDVIATYTPFQRLRKLGGV